MNSKLKLALKEMNEVDFFTLKLHIQTADMCRDIQRHFEITNETMAEKLGLTLKKFILFRKGAYDYSLLDWAELQRIQMEYGVEALGEKVKSQVSFPDYKYNKPQESTK